MAALQLVVDSLAIEQLAGLQVERKHFARAEPPLAHDVLGCVVPDAGLRRDGEVAVAGDHVARRAQPVTIERTGRVTTVSQDDSSRPVPRFHVRRVVLVERA